VYWSQEPAFDLEVEEVNGTNDKDNQAIMVKVKGKEDIIPLNQLTKFAGPRLLSEDLKKGAHVQFRRPHQEGQMPEIKPFGKGVIEGQTNTEVCLKLQEGSRKSQLWVSREDIHFLYVMVFSAHSLKNTDQKLGMGVMNNKSDPYIKIHVQNTGSADSALQDKEGKAHNMLKTKVLDDNLDPEWNQDFRFLYFDNVESLRFEVRDSDIKVGSLKEDDFLGHAYVPRDKWEAAPEQGFCEELTLTDEKGDPMKGDQGKESKIKVRVKLFEPKDHTDIDIRVESTCCGCQPTS